jgi:6-phosphogluconolactonase
MTQILPNEKNQSRPACEFEKILAVMSIKNICALVSVAALAFAWTAPAKEFLVYFGTFTNQASKGIYVSRLDDDTGKLSAPELAAETPNPNFLTVSSDGKYLYAATRMDTFSNVTSGAVSAFAIDHVSGKLKFLDEKSTGGPDCCFVGEDAADQTIFAANYSGGSVKSFHVKPDGSLTEGTFIQHHGSSVNTNRQNSPHAHCFVAAPSGRFALACDLGMDKVMIYKINATTAALSANDPAFATLPPGSGPRHIAFSPDGRTACVINEMACTISVFAWDGLRGKLDARETVALLPPTVPVKDTFAAAEIAARPDGKFVYATVRGADCISVLTMDAKTGKLSLLENVPSGGSVPRGMGIDPAGRWLIVGNQKSQTVTIFAINAMTGRLAPTGQVLKVGSPVDVKFAPR